MTPHSIYCRDRHAYVAFTVVVRNWVPNFLCAFLATLSFSSPSHAIDLPAELPLRENGSATHAFERDDVEQGRSHRAPPGSLTGLVFP